MPFHPAYSQAPGTPMTGQPASSNAGASQPGASTGKSGNKARLRRVSARSRSSASAIAFMPLCTSAPSTPSASALIHASMRLPPQVLSMMPIGTPVLLRNWRAKKCATAENSPATSGDEATHSPPASCHCGSPDHACGTLKCRTNESVDRRISASASFDAAIDHSMFDCPDANHTSPTRTSCNSFDPVPSSIRIT